MTFFLGGMKTSQITTANLIYYLSQHPEVKEKLLKEIKLENTDLSYEQIMEFDYLQQCINETLRLEPPAPLSQSQHFI